MKTEKKHVKNKNNGTNHVGAGLDQPAKKQSRNYINSASNNHNRNVNISRSNNKISIRRKLI